jgi:hypothetical protein
MCRILQAYLSPQNGNTFIIFKQTLSRSFLSAAQLQILKQFHGTKPSLGN